MSASLKGTPEHAGLLAELVAVHGILLGMLHGAFGAAKAGGGYLHPCGAGHSLATSKPLCSSPGSATVEAAIDSRMQLL